MKKIIKIALIAVSIILVCCLGMGALTYRPLSDGYIKEVGDNARKIWDIPAVSIEVMDSETVRFSYIDGFRRAGSEDRVTREDWFFILKMVNSDL